MAALYRAYLMHTNEACPSRNFSCALCERRGFVNTRRLLLRSLVESDKRLRGLTKFHREICRMRSFVSSLATVIMFSLLAVLFGCNVAGMKSESTANQQPPLPSTSPAGDGAARINVTDLREALNKGTAYVVDVRTDDQYKSGHIKGAVHIPEMDIAARAGELPRDKTIVTYCS